jgi:Xaa-Pro aminopeptidase
MRYTPISNSLFVNNRSRFTAMLPARSLAVFVSAELMPRNGDQFFPFRQQSDFFYLTGIDKPDCSLILFPDCPNPALREVLFMTQPDEQRIIWEGRGLTLDQARIASGIEKILPYNQFTAVLQEVMNYAGEAYLNSNEYIKFQSDTETNNQRFTRRLLKKYPLHTFNRAAPILEKLRTIKSSEEIELLEKAAGITAKAFNRVLKASRPGRYEFEIQAEIEHEFTINRANGHGYQPIIASGEHACTLHYTSNNSLLTDGQLLLLDMGAEYANYSADLSRTIPVNGRFNKRQKQCYDAVLRVFRQAKNLYRPGNTIEYINTQVWKLLEEEMIGLGLFTMAQVKNQSVEAPLFRKYMMHGVAHHIGLDVHDVGSKFEPLAPGMVLTLEPGLYIREEKIGIRIENDLLVTTGNPIDLMEDVPIETEEIELIMANNQ